MKTHSMIDIETLASSDTAAVIAIGVAFFTDTEIVNTEEFLINPILAIGDRVPENWAWWQSEVAVEVMNHMFSGKGAPWDICKEFQSVMYQYKPKTVWANPPTFDLTVLRSLYRATGYKVPWHWREERCCKTLWNMCLDLGIDPPTFDKPRGDKHSAVADAVHQAKVVQHFWKALKS